MIAAVVSDEPFVTYNPETDNSALIGDARRSAA